ncbi:MULTISPECIES: TspO/MBR family protein [unclassified Streptomyces]|uniref:TspO/MBR family protein n=1 Tax=unclassified Streptomyces TaxID=2593676 RepID=UPI002E339ADF|nr:MULTISPECIES: TspO/MBR family protein [unclassified Streptomyces]WUC68087.1 tryptophan-rich sensory protein [Streptomyces sp. NBC_00539]
MAATATPKRGRGAGSWGALAAFLVVTYGVAALGALAAADAGQVYSSLEKPSWAPPAWLFGPVWTLLYALIAVGAWLVWRHPNRPRVRSALVWWWVQLVLNLAWTPLFFGAGQFGLALLDIGLLLGAVGVTSVLFHRLDRAAALLLGPYVAWVAFAAALNAAIWWLNT